MPKTKRFKVSNGRVHGKEHLGRLRGFGFVVSPSQVIGSANRYASSLPDPRMEIEYLRLQLQIRDEHVQALEAGLQTTDAKLESVNQKVQSLQRQMSYLLHYLGIQIPPSIAPTQDTQIAEAVALRESLNFLCNRGTNAVMFETNCLQLVQAFHVVTPGINEQARKWSGLSASKKDHFSPAKLGIRHEVECTVDPLVRVQFDLQECCRFMTLRRW